MKDMVKLEEFDWKAMFVIARPFKDDKDHELTRAIDDAGWIIHEVRTMKNYVSSHYFSEKRKTHNRSDYESDEWWKVDTTTERGKLAHNVRRLNNGIENIITQNLKRLMKKYE